MGHYINGPIFEGIKQAANVRMVNLKDFPFHSATVWVGNQKMTLEKTGEGNQHLDVQNYEAKVALTKK